MDRLGRGRTRNPSVLLILTSALFAAAWHTDRAHDRSPAAAAPTATAAVIETVAPGSMRPRRPSGHLDSAKTLGETDCKGDNTRSPVQDLRTATRCAGSTSARSPSDPRESRSASNGPAGEISQAPRPVRAPVPSRSFAHERLPPSDQRSAADLGTGSPPLPVDITAGEYRVVSSRGTVTTFVLTPERADCYGMSGGDPRKLYQIDEAGERWYFIRVEAPQRRVGENTMR